jgi:cardiolipin synthase
MSTVTWLALGETLWVLGVCGWIIAERRSPTATLAWIFALVWMPYIGIAVYLLVGPRRLTSKKRRHAAARSRVRQAACIRHAAGDDVSRTPPLDERWRQVVQLVERAGEGPLLRCERLELFTGGDECYARLEQAITAAERHVHLEYYIWEPDRIGTRFRDLLCAKARAGVEVRLLVDAIGSDRLSRKFLAPLRQAGAEVAWFNPLTWARLRPGLINFRTHRKIVVCDGRVGFTGGINICDDHSVAIAGSAAWRDTHVMVEGLAVGWLQSVFLEDWDFATGSAVTDARYFPEMEQPATGRCVQIIASGPDHPLYAIHRFYFSAIAAARERVLITTPYFVPDEPIADALTTAALRGVEVRVLVPRRSDSRLVAAASRSYFEELGRAGVRIYEYGPAMLHAKTLVVDRDLSAVGTANMDNRSFRLNFEVLAAIYDAAVTDELAAAFARDLQHAEEYRLGRARAVPAVQRLAEAAARLFSPLL